MACAAAILHREAEAPSIDGCTAPVPDRCYLCGCTSPALLGRDRLEWMGGNFTDQNKVRIYDGSHVCEHCIWACSWVAPPGLRGTGARGPRLTQYSHCYDARGWRWFTKAEKPAIRQWLREPGKAPWFAAIADSGKKHLLPWTPINHGGVRGVVRFEESVVTLGDWRLVDEMATLLTAGVRKAELESWDFETRTLVAHAEAVRDFCSRWRSEHRGRWYALALWLAQKEDR